jgi:hypothetical protein
VLESTGMRGYIGSRPQKRHSSPVLTRKACTFDGTSINQGSITNSGLLPPLIP